MFSYPIRNSHFALLLALFWAISWSASGQNNENNNFEAPSSNKPAAKSQKQPANSNSKAAIDNDDDGESSDEEIKSEAESLEELKAASSPKVRRFHEVMDELLAEFGYDIKTGQIKGLKNLSIRKVTVNSALPKSYHSYVELLVAERIRENSQIRLISCVSCKNKTTRMVAGKLIITSPNTNMAEMEKAASTMGIDYFMDVVLVYHLTHMVLGFQIFNTETKEMVWSRTYNSETIKSRFQKLSIDYSQVEKGRIGEDYAPEYRYLIGGGGAVVPNVTGDSNDTGMMLLHFRGTEKFDNRRSEFGMVLNIFQSANKTVSSYPTTGSDSTDTTTTDTTTTDTKLKPFTTAIGLHALYAYNFLGALESYNTTRFGATVSLGPLLAPGYMAMSARFGLDVYFGRRFAVTVNAIYLAGAKILVKNEFVETKGGTGGEFAVVVNI